MICCYLLRQCAESNNRLPLPAAGDVNIIITSFLHHHMHGEQEAALEEAAEAHAEALDAREECNHLGAALRDSEATRCALLHAGFAHQAVRACRCSNARLPLCHKRRGVPL
jgi:hypothetical protein